MHHQRAHSPSASPPMSTKIRFVPQQPGAPSISVPVYAMTDATDLPPQQLQLQPPQHQPAIFSSPRSYSPETPSPKEIAIPPTASLQDKFPPPTRTHAAPRAPISLAQLTRLESVRRSMNSDKRKPLPPLPGATATSDPLIRPQPQPRAATPVLQVRQSFTQNRSVSVSPKLGTIPESPRTPRVNSAPVELPTPVIAVAELEASSPSVADDKDDDEVHMHAQLLPICAKCARMNPELYWQFPGAGLEIPEVPLTPPDTPESPGQAVPLEWHTLKQMPDSSSRNITSWLALTPPASGASSFIDLDMDDEEEEEEEDDIFDLEAELTTLKDDEPSPSALVSPMLGLPSEILLQIFNSLPDLKSVSALSRAHPRLHMLFAERTNSIAHAAIEQSSPSLYDLVNASGSIETAAELADAIAVKKATVHKIKCTIRNRCRFFLSKAKLAPSSAADEKAFDDALFLLWNFSNTFAVNSEAAGDVDAQVSWLRKQELKMQELKDVLEMYQCIGALLCPLTSDLKSAVRAGVVDVMPVPTQMEEALEHWVMYLQTLGLDKLQSVLVAMTDTDQWKAIEEVGLNTGGGADDIVSGRRVFLKAAVGTIVKELCEIERKERLMRKWGEEGVWGPTWES